MKNSNLPIDQRHKQLLRNTLMAVRYAQPLPVDRKLYFFMRKTSRFVFVPALAVVGAVVWFSFASTDDAQSGFAGIRAALAAEAQQAAQNLVHHQKIQSRDSMSDGYVIEEHWMSDFAHASTYTNAQGVVESRNLETYNADGSIQKRYASYAVDLAFSKDPEVPVMCVLNASDAVAQVTGAAKLKKQADALSTVENIQDRQTLVNTLLSNSNVDDLGTRDGRKVFAITMTDATFAPAETTRYEYAFNPSTFSLEQYSVHYFIGTPDEYTATFTYITNEYVDEQSLPQGTLTAAGLTEVSDVTMNLADKSSGCYNKNSGEKVADLYFTTEVTESGKIALTIDVSQNEYADNMIIKQNLHDNSIASIYTLGEPSNGSSGSIQYIFGD